MTVFTRRRFLFVSAACAATPTFASSSNVATWRGRAMGASVSMKLTGLSSEAAAPIFAAVENELERLERIFSIYRTDSQVSVLNSKGVLSAPAPELLQVMSMSDHLHSASEGVFDPTIQPLWIALARGEPQERIEEARSLVGWGDVRFDASTVELGKAGQALTFNGIAQGFVSDRIAGLLKRKGLKDVLLDMGEIAARGVAPDGNAWTVGVAAVDGTILKRTTLNDRALATSAPMGTGLGTGGHILGPQGQASTRELVSVSAPKAAVADGLSTALCLMGQQDGERLLSEFPGARIEALA